MADEVTIQHPVFKDQFYNVPADSVSDWEEGLGWLKGDAPEGVVVTGPPAGQSPRDRAAEAEAAEQPAEAPKASGKSGKSDKPS